MVCYVKGSRVEEESDAIMYERQSGWAGTDPFGLLDGRDPDESVRVVVELCGVKEVGAKRMSVRTARVLLNDPRAIYAAEV